MPTPAPSQRLADAVASVVSALGLTTDATPPVAAAVAKRKRPVLVDGDPLPLVVVCVGDEEEYEPLYRTGTGLLWLVRRPVAVAVAFKALGKVGENADLRRFRDAAFGGVTAEALRAAGGGLRVSAVEPRGRPIFDGAALSSAQVDWSVLSLTVETLEEK